MTEKQEGDGVELNWLAFGKEDKKRGELLVGSWPFSRRN